MNMAKEINDKLDEILYIQAEIKRMTKDLKEDSQITNVKTGKSVSRKEAEGAVRELLNEIYIQLNKITHNGKRVKGVFNNTYYVNDPLQDKLDKDK